MCTLFWGGSTQYLKLLLVNTQYFWHLQYLGISTGIYVSPSQLNAQPMQKLPGRNLSLLHSTCLQPLSQTWVNTYMTPFVLNTCTTSTGSMDAKFYQIFPNEHETKTLLISVYLYGKLRKYFLRWLFSRIIPRMLCFLGLFFQTYSYC